MADLDVIRTERGFAVEVKGKFIEIPVGFMRISERTAFSEFLRIVIEEVTKENN